MKSHKFDARWVLSLFGTVVGTGILYLPIKAGAGGVLPVIAMYFIIFPMVYLSHRALSRFVPQANGADKDITHTAEKYFGRKTALFISVLYFFAISPICLAYCVGISNTFEGFIYHQFMPLASENVAESIQSIYSANTSGNGKVIANLAPFYRVLLVFILVSSFMLVMLLSEELIIKICEWFVYPLRLILSLFSLYPTPHWNLESFTQIPHFKEFITIIRFTLPALVFSFNHSPAISTFTLSMKRHYKEHKDIEKTNQILFKTFIMLFIFMMFFVFSCVFSLNGEEFSDARAQNIPVLSYFANRLDNPIIAHGGPLVVFLAITSSFFGHYFGARGGAYGIVRKCCKMTGVLNPNQRLIKLIYGSVMYIIMLLVGFYNPNVLDFIEKLGGPIIAAVLFLMPMIAIHSISKLKKFQNKPLDLFVFTAGLLTIITVVYSF